MAGHPLIPIEYMVLSSFGCAKGVGFAGQTPLMSKCSMLKAVASRALVVNVARSGTYIISEKHIGCEVAIRMFRLSLLRLFGIIVALGLGLFLMLALQLNYGTHLFFLKPEKFEASTWLLLRKEHSPRLECMAKDLVSSQELSGMTFNAVVQKLGSPDSTLYVDQFENGVPNPDPKEIYSLAYYLQSPYRQLIIWFTPSGVASKTIMVSTSGL